MFDKLQRQITKIVLRLYEFDTWSSYHFHMCNTMPVKAGGESGKRLKRRSLMLICGVRKDFGDDFNIIGGGGIYSFGDVKEYQDAGATHFSLATIWFKPWKALKILKNFHKIAKD